MALLVTRTNNIRRQTDHSSDTWAGHYFQGRFNVRESSIYIGGDVTDILTGGDVNYWVTVDTVTVNLGKALRIRYVDSWNATWVEFSGNLWPSSLFTNPQSPFITGTVIRVYDAEPEPMLSGAVDLTPNDVSCTVTSSIINPDASGTEVSLWWTTQNGQWSTSRRLTQTLRTAGSFTFNIVSLSKSTTYYYALAIGTDTPGTVTASFTTLAEPIPILSARITSLGNTFFTGTITVRHVPSSGFLRLLWRYRQVGATLWRFANTPTDRVTTANTSLTAEGHGLQANRVYEYEVFALFPNGGAWTATLVSGTFRTRNEPSRITDVKATADNTSITLTVTIGNARNSTPVYVRYGVLSSSGLITNRSEVNRVVSSRSPVAVFNLRNLSKSTEYGYWVSLDEDFREAVVKRSISTTNLPTSIRSTSITPSDIRAAATVVVSNPEMDTTVYFRWSSVRGTWPVENVMSDVPDINNEVLFNIAGLSLNTTYYYSVRLDDTVPGAVSTNFKTLSNALYRFGEKDPRINFRVNEAARVSFGSLDADGDITSDGQILWVLRKDRHRLYAYQLNTGAYTISRNIEIGTLSEGLVVCDGTNTWHYRNTPDAQTGVDTDTLSAINTMHQARQRSDVVNDIPVAEVDGNYPYGCTDGTTIWMVRGLPFGVTLTYDVIAYNIASKRRDTSKDIKIQNVFASGAGLIPRIATDGTTIWVLIESYFYAYNVSNVGRNTAKDFHLHYNDEVSGGIWADSTTMYMVNDAGPLRAEVVGYSLLGSQAVPQIDAAVVSDIDLNSATFTVTVSNPYASGSLLGAWYTTGSIFNARLPVNTLPVKTLTPRSNTAIWRLEGLSEGSYYTIRVHLGGFSLAGDHFHRDITFQTDRRLPVLENPTILVGTTKATIRATVRNAAAVGTRVYLRIRQRGSTSWRNISAQDALPTQQRLTFEVTGLSPSTDYEFQISLSLGYTDAATIPFTTLPTSIEYVRVTDRTPNTAKIEVAVDGAFAVGTRIYLRYRRRGTSAWTNASAQDATNTIPVRTFTLTNLNQETVYEFQASLNLSYFQALTRTFTTTRDIPVPVLGDPTVEVEDTSAEVMALVTHPIATGTRVYFRYRVSPSGTWMPTARDATPGSPIVTFALTSLTAATIYQYQISFSMSFTGARTLSFRTLETALDPMLEIPSVVVTQTTAAISVTVANPDITGSRVRAQYRRQGTVTWMQLGSQVTASSLTVLTFNATGLNEGTNYEYRLSLSDFTDAVIRMFTTSEEVVTVSVGVPSITTTFDSFSAEVTISNPPAVGVTIRSRYRLGTSGFWINVAAQDATPSNATLTFTDDELEEDSSYQFQVSDSPSYFGAPVYTFMTMVEVLGPSLGVPTVTTADTSATVFVTAAQPKAVGTRVHCRYRLRGTQDWTNVTAQDALPDSPQVSFPIFELTAATIYEFQVSLNLSYMDETTYEFMTRGGIDRLTSAPSGLSIRWDDNTAIVTWSGLVGADAYSLRYEEVGAGAPPPVQQNFIEGTTVRISGRKHSTTYAFQVAGSNARGRGPFSRVVQSTSPDPVVAVMQDSVFVEFDPDGDGQLEDVTNRLFSADGRWGGTGRVPLDKILPANGVITLENSDGHFVKNEIRLNTEIRFGIRLNNVEHLLGGGYIQDVDEFYDPERGIRNLIIIHSGIFDRLAQEDGETAIVISDPFDALTSEVVERALAKNTRVPAAQREIDHGQVRISSSNSPLISTSGLTKANLMQVLRQMAISEGGDLDEGRGLSVRFHSRFAREQTSAIDGRYFADVHEGNRARVVWRDWRSDWYGGHIYTRVRGTQINQVPVAAAKLYSKVYTIDADKPVISANQSYPFIADLQRDPGARELLTVSEALNWNKIRPQDIQFETLAGNAISEGSVSVEPGVPGQIHLADLDDTPSQYRFTIRNNTNAPIRIKQIDLYGEGIQRLSDYQTELENAEAVVAHNIQRTLELGQMYAGAGYNGANTASATTAYLAYVLQKYSRPRNIAWIEWDARDLYPGEAPGPGRMGLAAQLGATLMVGDIINLVTSEAIRDELAPGSWFVEGGSYSYSVNRGLTYRLNISRRGQVAGRVSNQRVSVTPSSTTPVNVGSSVSLSAGKVYAVIVSASIPAGPIDGSTWSEDDAVLQLVDANGNILRTWLERDFFPGYEVNVSATLRQEVAGSIQLRAKLRATGSPAISVTRLQVIDRDDVS